jgi:protein-S-isoprenylcysteine O-methyltransferase Ste14
MNELTQRAAKSLVKFHLLLAVFLFGPAWSLRFWQGWVYWLVCTILVTEITRHFLKHDPRLIERRMAVGPRAEPEASQKRIQVITSVLCCALVIIPGLDFRRHWSHVPVPISLLADALVALGYLGIFYVFRENTFTAGVVRVEEGQTVISTGPYAYVRHPMYAAAMWQFLATPIALGSWWAFLAAVPLCGMLVIRLLDEERVLRTNLAGYTEYCQKVLHRLIPGVW